jgi:hypothetical protein
LKINSSTPPWGELNGFLLKKKEKIMCWGIKKLKTEEIPTELGSAATANSICTYIYRKLSFLFGNQVSLLLFNFRPS